MLGRALDAGVPVAWVTGDEVYGGDRSLRLFLEERRQPFVLAVRSNEPLMVEIGRYARPSGLVTAWEEGRWERASAGDGAKGPRLYDWALVPLWRLQLTREERAWSHRLLVRRSVEDLEETAYYVVFAPGRRRTWGRSPRWRARAGAWSRASKRPSRSAAWTSTR